MLQRRHPVYDMPPPPPKDGWWETWPSVGLGGKQERGRDGTYWVKGYRLGRVIMQTEHQWKWTSSCHQGGAGLEATKEAAKRAVEAAADLDRLTESCYPNYHETRLQMARERSKSAAI
ncbi:MAG: hypothetical protein AAGH43_06250 [Pseudomonadota bacterium]